MDKILIYQRQRSYGELQELKRLQAYEARRQKNSPGRAQKPGRLTAVFKPPTTDYGALNLAPDNSGV